MEHDKAAVFRPRCTTFSPRVNNLYRTIATIKHTARERERETGDVKRGAPDVRIYTYYKTAKSLNYPLATRYAAGLTKTVSRV